MFALLVQEEINDSIIIKKKLDGLEVLVKKLKKMLPTFESVYNEVSTEEEYAEFLKKEIKDIYDNV